MRPASGARIVDVFMFARWRVRDVYHEKVSQELPERATLQVHLCQPRAEAGRRIDAPDRRNVSAYISSRYSGS